VIHRLLEECISADTVVHFSTVVTAVRRRQHDVEVDAIDASGGACTFNARAIVVTVAAGVLQHNGVRFEPELPLEKREALSAIEMGHVAKVVLGFRSPFWEEIDDARYHDAGFFRAVGQPFAAFWTQYPLRAETITAWSGGPKSIALLELSESERIERALEGFGALIGDPQRARAEFVSGATHDWRRDPFARGAYSYLRIGGVWAHAALAKPVDDALFFAGEATSTDGQGGTVNGALQTGERAAREVAAALERKHR
jgi:monoamine oxidase